MATQCHSTQPLSASDSDPGRRGHCADSPGGTVSGSWHWRPGYQSASTPETIEPNITHLASSLMRDSLLQVSHTPTVTVTVSGRDSRCASDSSIQIHPNLRKSGGRDSVQEGGEVKPARPEHTRTSPISKPKRLVAVVAKALSRCQCCCKKQLSSYLRVCHPKWWSSITQDYSCCAAMSS